MQEQTVNFWTLINVKGDVRVRVSGIDWTSVHSGQSFSSNHSAGILTGEDGSLEVHNNLGETVRITPKSLIVFHDKTWERVKEFTSDIVQCQSQATKSA